MKKAYFFDMDGTLYSHRFHEVPPNTLKALYQLKEQGHLVCLATSRTAQELAHLEQEVRTFPFDYRIIDGGAVVLDRNGKCVKKTAIAPHISDRIASWCRRTGTPWRYACEDGMWWDIEGSQKEHDILFSLYLAVPEKKAYEHDEIVNAIVFTKNREAIAPLIQDCSVIWYGSCVEIRAGGVDKAHAIRQICEKEHIAWRCCFGDGSNDIQMIEEADLGIAMGNAAQALCKAADRVIGTVDEDGIWNYMQESMEGE